MMNRLPDSLILTRDFVDRDTLTLAAAVARAEPYQEPKKEDPKPAALYLTTDEIWKLQQKYSSQDVSHYLLETASAVEAVPDQPPLLPDAVLPDQNPESSSLRLLLDATDVSLNPSG